MRADDASSASREVSVKHSPMTGLSSERQSRPRPSCSRRTHRGDQYERGDPYSSWSFSHASLLGDSPCSIRRSAAGTTPTSHVSLEGRGHADGSGRYRPTDLAAIGSERRAGMYEIVRVARTDPDRLARSRSRLRNIRFRRNTVRPVTGYARHTFPSWSMKRFIVSGYPRPSQAKPSH